ncbi:hypothetical protein PInf_005933 [Phytophthora infestans]|nr:hypothetical protein PInf_005933 [Phytophthora infestans]
MLASKKRFAFVKLKKGETSDETVLSDCEKYNVVRAESLPSAKFYETFADLRAAIRSFKKKWGLDRDSLSDAGESDDESDAMGLEYEIDCEGVGIMNNAQLPVSTVEEADIHEPPEDNTSSPVMQGLDGDDLPSCCLTNPSQTSLPDLTISEQSQEVLQQQPNVHSATSTASLLAQPGFLLERAGAIDNMQVLRLPEASSSRSRNTKKGSKWAIAELGKLARSKRLNDAVMDAALWHVSTYCKTCYGIDAISVTNEKRFVPDFSLASCNYVLVPIHMAAFKHWIIQIVKIQMADPDTSKLKIWVTFYDLLGVASNLDLRDLRAIAEGT